MTVRLLGWVGLASIEAWRKRNLDIAQAIRDKRRHGDSLDNTIQANSRPLKSRPDTNLEKSGSPIPSHEGVGYLRLAPGVQASFKGGDEVIQAGRQVLQLPVGWAVVPVDVVGIGDAGVVVGFAERVHPTVLRT